MSATATSKDGYEGHQGWRNRVTWNVGRWIGKDEGLYAIAIADSCDSYAEFVAQLRESVETEGFAKYETPDGVAWNDSALDTDALDALIAELAE